MSSQQRSMLRKNNCTTNLRVLNYKFTYPLYLFLHYRSIMLLWSFCGQLSHRLFKYQTLLSNFQNLKTIYTKSTASAIELLKTETAFERFNAVDRTRNLDHSLKEFKNRQIVVIILKIYYKW